MANQFTVSMLEVFESTMNVKIKSSIHQKKSQPGIHGIRVEEYVVVIVSHPAMIELFPELVLHC